MPETRAPEPVRAIAEPVPADSSSHSEPPAHTAHGDLRPSESPCSSASSSVSKAGPGLLPKTSAETPPPALPSAVPSGLGVASRALLDSAAEAQFLWPKGVRPTALAELPRMRLKAACLGPLLTTGLMGRARICWTPSCFSSVGLAPICASFSTAITPPIRTSQFREGRPGVSLSFKKKLLQGNQHASFALKVVKVCIRKGLPFWLENPDSSWLWRQPSFRELFELKPSLSFWRYDCCRFAMPWRKRTRVLTTTGLAGTTTFCLGGHKHLLLRGRSKRCRMAWTRVAEEYPEGVCRLLASALSTAVASSGGSVSDCVRRNGKRIGEADKPGPRAPKMRASRPFVRRRAARGCHGQTAGEHLVHLQGLASRGAQRGGRPRHFQVSSGLRRCFVQDWIPYRFLSSASCSQPTPAASGQAPLGCSLGYGFEMGRAATGDP